MGKVILLAILAVLGWWYFDGSRRMTEADIRASYQADQAAFSQLDAEPLCDRMHADFALVQTVNGEARQLDKAGTCADLRKSFDAMKHLGFGSMPFRVETTIEEIALAPDHKSAAVTATAVTRLANMTLMRTHGTERLIRRMGHIRSLGGESRTWAYARQ